MKLKNVLILAGGQSTRFWPLSHKNLLPFLGKPLIVHQLELYSSIADSVVVVTNSDTYDDIAGAAEKFGIKVLVQNGEGQAAAILTAKDHISGETLIANANDIYKHGNTFPEKILEKKSQGNLDGILTVLHVNSYFPGGYLILDNGKVTGVVEKPHPDNMPSPYWKFVLDYFLHIEDFIQVLEQTSSHHDDVYEVALSEYIQKGKNFEFIEYTDDWSTLKYPWHMLDASEYFLKSVESYVAPTAHVHESVILQGAVFIDEGAKVHEFAKIIGPAYIGRNVVIGNYSMVNASMIGEGSVIGGYSEITRSYIGPSTWTHRAYIGDSVVEGPANFAAGSVTANLRFDKNHVKSVVKGEKISSERSKLGVIAGANIEIGINASTMPGVKLAPGTSVMPGSVLFKDNV